MKSYVVPISQNCSFWQKIKDYLSCENQSRDQVDLLTWLVRNSGRGFGLNTEENILVTVSTV